MMIYFKMIPDVLGDYLNSTGERFSVCMARRVRSPLGVNIGYEPFPSLEAALEHWGLGAVSPATRDSCK